MSDFIRVFGDDPRNKGEKTHLYIHRGTIAKIVPVWAVMQEGRLADCTPAFQGAKVYFAQLIDMAGNVYSCGDPEEMEKLMGPADFARFRGTQPEARRIGFDGGTDAP
jgi:hypothetical protein